MNHTSPAQRLPEQGEPDMVKGNSHDSVLDDGDRLREECGVFGIFGHPDAAAITALGLHALQHRGQEAAGIVSFDGQRFYSERRLGLVGDTWRERGSSSTPDGSANPLAQITVMNARNATRPASAATRPA